MATESSSAHGASPAWLHARELWAGLSIMTIWLAVLFVGVFGGDFVSSSTTNGLTRFPVVVFLLPFALPATIVIARRAFTGVHDERRGATDEAAQAHEKAASEPSTLRATRAG
jgi:hypothetical protein